jgi:hypothetical protein
LIQAKNRLAFLQRNRGSVRQPLNLVQFHVFGQLLPVKGQREAGAKFARQILGEQVVQTSHGSMLVDLRFLLTSGRKSDFRGSVKALVCPQQSNPVLTTTS